MVNLAIFYHIFFRLNVKEYRFVTNKSYAFYQELELLKMQKMILKKEEVHVLLQHFYMDLLLLIYTIVRNKWIDRVLHRKD